MIKAIQIFSLSTLKSFTNKILLIVFLLALSQQAFAQVSDNFSDNDFQTAPQWIGSDSKFTATDQRLQLNAPAITDVAYLSTASIAINDAIWEFTVHLDFNPSSTNYAQVYLAANNQDLTGSLNGYYVMIGNTLDEISLYKQTNTTKTKIIDGLDGRIDLNTVDVNVRVTRDDDANWQLFADVGLTGNYISEGVVQDAQHSSSAYFGVYCKYTSTRSEGFFFDDFSVTGEAAVTVPSPTYKEIIITEIFADPAPRIDLPEAEYIELYNRSGAGLSLSGLQLSDGSNSATLPNYLLKANEFVIVTSSSNEDLFNSLDNVVAVSGFPSLNNTSDALTLRSPNNALIDSVRYNDSWYASDEKKQGGWSLELIDINNICGEEDNWAASEDASGGTPGKENSVKANKPDTRGPKIISAMAISPVEIIMNCDEKLKTETIQTLDITLNPLIEITSVQFVDNTLRSLRILLAQPLAQNTIYEITASTLQDCNGNNVQAEFNKAPIAVTEPADSLDVIVNEILFNPRPTCEDFVELFNNSTKIVSLKNWSIANLGSEGIENKKSITTSDFILKPKGYVVLTINKDALLSNYLNAVDENIIEVASLPSFNDETGSVVVINEENKMVDYLFYDKAYHSVFIKDEEGVSLERILSSIPTNTVQNWKSASSLAGYATPGYINSNARDTESIADESIKIVPEVFNPVTGQPNFVEIKYSFEQAGYVANIKIFDANGQIIKQLANNELLATAGFIRWDGDRDDGAKARIGQYMVWFEVFNSSGFVKTFRKRVAIAGRF